MRYLYTFVAGNHRIDGVLLDPMPELMLQKVAAAVIEPRPNVSFFRVMMDGWGATHSYWGEQIIEASTLVRKIVQELDESSMCFVTAPDIDVGSLTPVRRDSTMDSLNYGAVEVFGITLLEWLRFVKGAGGRGGIRVDVIGPTFDDSEFGE